MLAGGKIIWCARGKLLSYTPVRRLRHLSVGDGRSNQGYRWLFCDSRWRYNNNNNNDTPSSRVCACAMCVVRRMHLTCSGEIDDCEVTGGVGVQDASTPTYPPPQNIFTDLTPSRVLYDNNINVGLRVLSEHVLLQLHRQAAVIDTTQLFQPQTNRCRPRCRL